MAITYVYPRSTPSADANLRNIFLRSGASNRNQLISDRLNPSTVNITYGYLGLFAQDLLTHDFRQCSDVGFHSFILDHAFAPSSLKGSVFRLSAMTRRLDALIFNQSFLTIFDLHQIQCHLHSLQDNTSITCSIPINSNFDSSNPKAKISLLIKASPVIARIKKSDNYSLSRWLKHNLQIPSESSMHLVAIKENEVSLSPRGMTKGTNYRLKPVTIAYGQLKEVFVATSMMAIPFILNSVPVYLSDKHPLYSLIGPYVPKLDKSKAFGLILNVIKKTTVSIDNFELLERYLIDLSKYTVTPKSSHS